MLHLVNLLEKRKYETKARKLFLDAFPKSERPSYAYMKRAGINHEIDLNIVLDGDDFIGLAFVVKAPSFYYLFFLAIVSEHRGEGYGHKVLSLIKERYGDKPIMLLAESTKVPCDNLEERLRRQAFYHSAGYYEQDYGSEEYGVIYESYSSGGYVSFEDYYEAMKLFWGVEACEKWVRRV